MHEFHKNTVHALAEMVAAMGLDHPSELAPHHVVRRISATSIASLDEIYPFLRTNQLIDGDGPERLQRYWADATAESFKFNPSSAPFTS